MKPSFKFFRLVSILALLNVHSLQLAAVAQTNSTNAGTLPARSFLGMGGISTTPERKASPRFAGSDLPMPPQQKVPWSAPGSRLPADYVSAATVLFAQGMADPRGCDYREVEVGTGNVWSGDGGVVKTHAWCFSTNGQQFAVCWNGLVYPTVSVGAEADFRADALACTRKVGYRWRNSLPEAYEVAYETCFPLKGCLLLRLGEPKLAADLWLALQTAAKRDMSKLQVAQG